MPLCLLLNLQFDTIQYVSSVKYYPDKCKLFNVPGGIVNAAQHSGAGILDHRNIGGNNSRNFVLLCGIDDCFYFINFLVENNGVERDVGADVVLVADFGDFGQVVERKIFG